VSPIGLAFACLRADDIGVSGLGFAVSAQTLGQLSLVLIGGAVADRLTPRIAMMIGDVTSAVSMCVLAAIFLTHSQDIVDVIAIAYVAGAASAMTVPSINAMLVRLVRQPEEVVRANAIVRTSGTLARVIAGPIAGFLASVFPAAWLIAADGISFLCSGLILYSMSIPMTARGSGTLFADIKRGAIAFVNIRWFVVIAVVAAIINAARAGGITVLGPYVISHRSHGATLWGLLSGAQMVGSVVALWTIAHIRVRRILLASLIAALFPGVLLLALGLNLSAAMLLFFALLSGGGISFFGLKTDTVIQRRVPTEIMARVSAFAELLAMMLAPLGAFVSGSAINSLGSPTLLIAWALIVFVTIISAFVSREVRNTSLENEIRVNTSA
jgi:hypothetical protein